MSLQGKTVWVVVDNKAGNRSQCLGVCEALGVTPEIVELTERPFGRVRGIFNGLWRVKKLPTAPWPDMVIAAGTVSIAVTKMIKRKSPKTFTVQLMDPRCDLRPFDVVAIAKHDNPPNYPNVVATIGAPNRVTKQKLQDEYKAWMSPFAEYKKPKIAVLIGGSSKRYTFDELKATKMAKELLHFAGLNNASLLITNSRRTGETQTNILRSYLKGPNIYFWGGKGSNPYFGMLAHADAIIAPADSVSMLSEAATTGKPVYVYDRKRHWGKKFDAFLQALDDAGYTRPFTPTTRGIFDVPSNPLNDSQKVADFIRKKLTERKD